MPENKIVPIDAIKNSELPIRPVEVVSSVPIEVVNIPSRYQTTDSSTRSVPTDAVNAEIALKTENQRKVNLIWETTQQRIAYFSIGIAIGVGAAISFIGDDPGNKIAAFVFLTGQASLITGFYFGRTNHQKTGGVGSANDSSR